MQIAEICNSILAFDYNPKILESTGPSSMKTNNEPFENPISGVFSFISIPFKDPPCFNRNISEEPGYDQ